MPNLEELAKSGVIYNPQNPVTFECRPECHRCSKVNPSGCTTCTNCGTPLNSKPSSDPAWTPDCSDPASGAFPV